MNIRRLYKFALGAGLLTISAVASSESLALALVDIQPDLALKLNGDQSDALSNRAVQQLGGASGSASDSGKIDAQRAIVINPLDAQAAAHLGILSQLGGDRLAAANMMTYAQRVSRRDAATQFWWIEYWAERGDVAKILQHYDVALRTSARAPSTLFPVLVAAVENPYLSRQIAQMLDPSAVWTEQFIQQFVQSTRDRPAISRFFLDLADLDFPASELSVSTAIARQIEMNRVTEGFELYSAFYSEQSQSIVRNPSFSQAAHLPTAFDWTLPDAGFYVGSGPDGLEIDAPKSASGPLATQIVRLPPGSWQANLYHNGGSTGSERIDLALACTSNGLDLPPAVSREPGLLETRIEVPSNCDYQTLTVSIRSSDTSDLLKIAKLEINKP